MQERRFVNVCALSKLSYGTKPDVFWYSQLFCGGVAIFPLVFFRILTGLF